MLQGKYSTNRAQLQARKGYTNLNLRGRGEGIGSTAAYVSQLSNMLQTARRNGWERVVYALSSLIARRGGIA